MWVIVPAAGNGQRFRAAGYTLPKPAIEVGGRSLLSWAFAPIPEDWESIVLCQRGDAPAVIRAMPRPAAILPLPGPTQGSACTALIAALALPPDAPVAIMNSDQTFHVDVAALVATAIADNLDGFILTFEARDDRWSYVATTAGLVTRVAEKVPISTQATVGFYWFRRAGDYVRACAKAIAAEDRHKGEFYTAPVYNQLLVEGARIAAYKVDGFVGLGTPEDVAAFAAECPAG